MVGTVKENYTMRFSIFPFPHGLSIQDDSMRKWSKKHTHYIYTYKGQSRDLGVREPARSGRLSPTQPDQANWPDRRAACARTSLIYTMSPSPLGQILGISEFVTSRGKRARILRFLPNG